MEAWVVYELRGSFVIQVVQILGVFSTEPKALAFADEFQAEWESKPLMEKHTVDINEGFKSAPIRRTSLPIKLGTKLEW